MRALRAAILVVFAALLMALVSSFQAAAQGKPKVEIVPQIPHSHFVTSVAFSADGKAPFAHRGEAALVFGAPACDPALCAAAIEELEPGGSNRLVEL